MTIREMFEELAMVHCEDYDIVMTGNYQNHDIGDVTYSINDDTHTVSFGEVNP